MKEASDQVNKKYNRIKLSIQVVEIIVTAAFFILLIFTNLSKTFRDSAFGVSGNKYMSFLVFVFIIGGIEKIISLPLDFYSGFLLEHKFNLSNQSIFEWFKENVKATLLSLILVLPLLIAFYYFIVRFQNLWWVPTGIIFILFSLLLTKIAPVVIFPLFYKFENIENDDIREKLSDFAEKNGIKISGVFSFNLSKNTIKAKAALAGFGNTNSEREKPLMDENPSLLSAQDDLPLWSAPFGLMLLDHIHLKPKIEALDVGFGSGFPLLELAQRLGDSSTVFLDVLCHIHAFPADHLFGRPGIHPESDHTPPWPSAQLWETRISVHLTGQVDAKAT